MNNENNRNDDLFDFMFENNTYENNNETNEGPEFKSQSYESSLNELVPVRIESDTKKSKKGKKHSSKKLMAAGLAGCFILSAVCGFGGGYLANMYGIGSSASASNKVIYQSVVRTSAKTTSETTALSVADIAELTANSVVEITTETVTTGSRMQQYVSEGAGSGVIITADGYIVTNNHVIDGASKITVRLKNEKTYSAKLIGTDSKTDIAVIKIDETGLQPAVYGDSSKLKVGELAVAIGNPLGELGGTVTDGIISALDREITMDGQTMNLLQTNTAINPGNSGGGLFNSNGELIGIVNAKSSGTDVEGLGFAIPINTAKTVIEQIISYGYVQGRVNLGMTLVDISDAQTAMAYRVQKTGVYVLKVTDNSNAANAGFTSGDCIISVDNTNVSTSADLNKLLEKHSVGDKLSVVVLRNGRYISLNLTLSEYKPS